MARGPRAESQQERSGDAGAQAVAALTLRFRSFTLAETLAVCPRGKVRFVDVFAQ
jgi:hypothetical protein